MSLSSGTRLGPYEIQSPLGAGGMGEVYRARDTRLDRTVAIKVLPAHLAGDAGLRQRFEREARAISGFQHPHICVLYDVGHENGTDYLVMEYLEGESLAKRLARGPLPVQELLKTGGQIAEALERAHRAGILHRDLKPGNIMLTKSGAKLLDFGLAKSQAVAGASALGGATATHANPASGPITTQGQIVGTMQYMSPEQVEGRELDARSDIFSLGAVLYEMATGKRAFEGKSSLSVASAILEKDPEPISAVQPMSPPALEHVVRTCLAKDPDERWQSAADVARQLQWISQAGSQAGIALPAKTRRRRWERMAWAGLAAVLVAALAAMIAWGRRSQPAVHAELDAAEGLIFDIAGDTSAPPALSPDGSTLVFGAHTKVDPQALWVRSLRTGSTQRLPGTDGAVFPFWSPDSRWIGFFADGKLKKIPAYGGPIGVLADTPGAPRGGAWLPGDVIVYTPEYRAPLWRINPGGGTPAQVTKLDPQQTTHRWPEALPDGKHFLYFSTSHESVSGPKNGVYFAALDGSVNKLVIANDAAAIYSDGYLLYHQQTQLVAQPFDASTGTLSGEPVVVAENIGYDSGTWRLTVTASQNGTLVYQRGTTTPGSQLVWMDRTGKTLGTLGQPAGYNGFRISPDGKHVVASLLGRTSNIYVLDVTSGLATRLTFDPGSNHLLPSWSPDGSRVVYAQDQGASSGPGAPTIHAKPANGTGGEQLLYRADEGGASWPEWSRDGRYLAFLHATGPSGATVEAVPAGGGKPFVVAKPQSASGNILDFDISADSRWIAYASSESGVPQVYVSAFPSGSGRWQVSGEGGGDNPMWSSKSNELFFAGLNFTLYEVMFNGKGADFEITGMQRLTPLNSAPPGGSPYDVSPDGKRFLVDVATQQSSAPLTLVLNWTAELKK